MQFFIKASFQKSGAKGRSKAHRLNDLLRELLGLMIKFGFVITWTWIATEENVDADHLSRGRVDDSLRTVYERGVWASTTVRGVWAARALCPRGGATWRAAWRRIP